MGGGKLIANLILSKQDILKQSKYIISYDFNSSNKCGIINVGLENIDSICIKYDNQNETVITNWNSQVIKCPNYAAVSIAWLLLSNICEYYQYPQHLVEFTHDGNVKTTFIFDVLNDETDMAKAMYVYSMSFNMNKAGINKENVAISKKLGIWDGYKTVCSFYLGAKIE